MQSKKDKSFAQRVATEDAMRAAFERLKSGKPISSPVGTKVTQNNVSREAGFSPSALRKERYPGLVAEIQKIENVSFPPISKTWVDTVRENPKIVDINRMLSLLAEVAELRKKVSELQAIINK